MKAKRLVGLFLLLFFLCAGCRGAGDNAEPAASAAVAVSTIRATNTPPATSTASPSATATIQPSATPRATRTTLPTASPTPLPTVNADVTPDIAATFEAIATPTQLGEYSSPDGRRVIQLFRYDCTLLPSADGEGYEQAYEMLRYVDSGARVHEFATQHQSCGGLGAAGLQGYFWSDDGRYFYYGTAREGVVDGCGYFSTPYYRLDTTDRSTMYLGYGPLSPDGTTLALWTDDNEMVIWLVSGEQLTRIVPSGLNPIPNTIAWSPDSQALVYVLTKDYCPEGSSTLTRLDLPELQPTVLRQDDPGYANVRWLSDDQLQLENVVGDMRLTVDAMSGEMIP